MKINSLQLILELTEKVNSHLAYANFLKDKPHHELNRKSDVDAWSVLECLEHLNLYGHFYIPEIQQRVTTSRLPNSAEFKSGYLGNKFALSMLPKVGMKTMKTFKSKNPIHSKLTKEKVLDTFIDQQKEFLTLLKNSKEKNLTKTKTSTTIPFLKFRLGDTLRFVIYHNERHVVQAKKMLADQK
ncbi:MAG: DinB family protein [Flavobacteriaceae bacterium]|nr:DinB family protein [Flavobacteriaceae bacterium]